ncbi:hypothetical protein ARMSODRAFT_982231 [Armillaria solidipes]|uniref:Transmembrane protein n=1 Tax=Armillaria solidipes TaxID=1076256 RepID=A0A2H3BBZ1_9AGAR|nr:hypothetical protein ARMSODRAFT_982231 [Armillaria solidipes]
MFTLLPSHGDGSKRRNQFDKHWTVLRAGVVDNPYGAIVVRACALWICGFINLVRDRDRRAIQVLGHFAQPSCFNSSSTESVQMLSTANDPPIGPSNQSVQSTATAPPNTNSTRRNRRTSIILSAVIGSAVSLLLVFGGVASVQKETPEMMPYVGDESQDAIEGNLTGSRAEDQRARGGSIGTTLLIDTSESQSAQQQEAPQAALGDVVAEVLRLRAQVLAGFSSSLQNGKQEGFKAMHSIRRQSMYQERS